MATEEAKSFVENVNIIANATQLATGDVIEDANAAKDAAETAAANANISAMSAVISEGLAHDWANKQYNNEVENGEYSAYHWSIKSAENAGDVTIDDNVTSVNYTWSSSKLDTLITGKSDNDHLHTGVYEPPIGTKLSAFNKAFAGTGSAETVTRSDHVHSIYEPIRTTFGSAYNVDFGTTTGTASEGIHLHDDEYMTKVTTLSAYNRSFVTNSEAPLEEEIQPGNHGHPALKIVNDPSGNTVATSTTVQGCIGQLDSVIGTLTIAEKTKLTASLTDTTYTVNIATVDVPVVINAGMTLGSHVDNALYSAGVQLDYDVAPDNLIEGHFDATISIVREANVEYAIAITINGTVEDSSYKVITGADTASSVDVSSITIGSWISELSNEDIIGVAIYNRTSATNVVINSFTVSWAGQPEGALVATGTTIDHSELTGTGAADGVHTTSDIQDLDTDLLAKADKITPTATGNIATLGATGNLVDSEIAATVIAEKMTLVGGTPILNNIITMDSNGDSLNSGTQVSDFALVAGSATQIFDVQAGTEGTDAVNFTQLGSVSTVADAAIPKPTVITADKFAKLNSSGTLDETTYDQNSFAQTAHNHAMTDITLLGDALDTKYAKVTTPATDNLPVFETGDILIDSGLAYTDIITSITTADAGSDQILNMVSLTQTEYDALTPVSTTMYFIVG